MTVSIIPQTVAFGDVGLGELSSATLLVSNSQGAPATLSIDPPFMLSMSVIPANTDDAMIDVLFQPPAAGAFIGAIRDQNGNILASATGRGRDGVSIEPTAIAFGELVVGNSDAIAIQVRNFSNATVQLTVGMPFTIAPTSVAPGATIRAVVVYAPQSAGTASAMISDGTNNLASVSGQATTELSLPAGTTRYRVHVPASSTTFALGANVLDSSEQVIGGALAYTDGDVVVDADGNVVSQSRSHDVLQVADQNVFVAGGRVATLSGNGGVVIAAGIGSSPASDIESNEGRAVPAAAQGVSDRIDAFAKTFASFDTLVAAGTGLRGFWGWGSPIFKSSASLQGAWDRLFRKHVNKEGLLAVNAYASLFGGVGGTVITGLGASGTVPGVTILAQSGISLAANAFSSFYSLGGLVLGSLFPFTVGLNSEMFGFLGSTVSSLRDATLQGRKKSRVYSHGNVDIVADGHAPSLLPGNIKIKAPTVVIGRHMKHMDAKPSDEVMIGATDVSVSAVKSATIEAIGSVDLESAGAVKVNALASTWIKMGEESIGQLPTGTFVGSKLFRVSSTGPVILRAGTILKLVGPTKTFIG